MNVLIFYYHQNANVNTSSHDKEAEASNEADVWGSHLNKVKEKSTTEDVKKKDGKESGSAFMANLGKKLLASATQTSTQVRSKLQ